MKANVKKTATRRKSSNKESIITIDRAKRIAISLERSGMRIMHSFTHQLKSLFSGMSLYNPFIRKENVVPVKIKRTLSSKVKSPRLHPKPTAL